MTADDFLRLFLVMVLLVSAMYDIWVAKIPNVVTFPSMLIGIIYHGASQGLSGACLSLCGLMVGGAVFLPFYLLKGMGAGDVKLMGAVGALVSLKGIIPVIVFTALAGGVYAFGLIFLNLRTCKRLIVGTMAMLKTFVLTGQIMLPALFEKGKKPQVRYGVVIAAGTLFSQFCWPLIK